MTTLYKMDFSMDVAQAFLVTLDFFCIARVERWAGTVLWLILAWGW